MNGPGVSSRSPGGKITVRRGARAADWGVELMSRVRRFALTFGVHAPILNAPMADIAGFELAAAVSEAGGLGVLAGDFMSPDDLRAAIARTRLLTRRPFAVNLRLPPRRQAAGDGAVLREALAALAAELGCPYSEIEPPSFRDQLAAVLELAPPVLSFSFGCLPEHELLRVQQRGTRVIAAATTLREVKTLTAAGVDAIVVQGSEAGGPRLNFESGDGEALVGLASLIGPALRVSSCPIIAAGGVMTGDQLAAALVAGASAAQCGTAFLACRESRAPRAHRELLRHVPDCGTVLTRTFSGHPTRVVANGLCQRLARAGLKPLGYPAQWRLTRAIVLAARRLGRADLLELACGQGADQAREGGAGAIVSEMLDRCERRLGFGESFPLYLRTRSDRWPISSEGWAEPPAVK